MPFGIYIHIPFCKKKCNYCAFYSIRNSNLESDFTNALVKEIEEKKNILDSLYKKYQKVTIFIGGGTPTLLSTINLAKIIEKLYKYIDKVTEFTIEANPESLTEEKVKMYRSIGINRISIGIQSFDDKVLEFLGRPHRLNDSLNAFFIANKHFENISIDLIGGIPDSNNIYDTSEKYIKELMPKHVSYYTLSMDKKNRWFKKIYVDENKQAYDYNMFCRLLKNFGYIHYETSNFALKGYECKHNINYWKRGEYIGFGPSAVSFFKNFKKNKDMRFKNVSNLTKYIKNPLNANKEIIQEDKAIWETIFLHLRTKRGLNKKIIKSLAVNEKYIKIFNNIDFLIKNKILQENKKYWYIPEKNFLLNNEIILWILKDI